MKIAIINGRATHLRSTIFYRFEDRFSSWLAPKPVYISLANSLSFSVYTAAHNFTLSGGVGYICMRGSSPGNFWQARGKSISNTIHCGVNVSRARRRRERNRLEDRETRCSIKWVGEEGGWRVRWVYLLYTRVLEPLRPRAWDWWGLRKARQTIWVIFEVAKSDAAVRGFLGRERGKWNFVVCAVRRGIFCAGVGFILGMLRSMQIVLLM